MLTKKQLDLLTFINDRVQRDGVSPSFDEMKEALDLRSKSGIHRLITALEERGFIRRLAHRARAIEIIKLPESLGGEPSPGRGGFTPRVVDGGKADAPAVKPSEPPIATLAEVSSVPLMGRIAAGTPISAIEHKEREVGVPTGMLGRGRDHYALHVKGDS
ncbi:MAG: S24 family peptidase, partial [Pseudomonadota bacterium]